MVFSPEMGTKNMSALTGPPASSKPRAIFGTSENFINLGQKLMLLQSRTRTAFPG
jgi:hypothetical protein